MVSDSLATGNGRWFIAGSTIHLDRDPRGSVGERWYWHVSIRGGGQIHVEMARKGLLGGFGPAVSSDGGRTYRWLCPTYDERTSFSLVVGQHETRVAATMPYGLDDLCRYVRACPEVWMGSFGRSEAGRDLPLLRLAATGSPRRRVVLTARHHACEATASRVLEGILREVVSARRRGDAWARFTEVIACPMVDVDGVERGDQGKARQPHDHNRDYAVSSRYAAVRNIRSMGLFEELPTAALDLHTPGLIGPLEERPFIIASGDRGDAEAIGAFATAVGDGRTSPLAVMVFDEPWNSASSTGQRCFVAWARSHPMVVLAGSVEYPNAAVRGLPLSTGAAHDFGRQIAVALSQVLD